MTLPLLNEKIKTFPTGPGVYIMKGAVKETTVKGKAKNTQGDILYIGKAKNLRARVRTYFAADGCGDGRPAIKFLMSKVCHVEYIITNNEKEALILEDTLLKQHKPKYNVRLKDDKTYVSIRLTVQDDFPRIFVTRDIKDDGSKYFGPFGSSGYVRETIKFLRTIFPICICSDHDFKTMKRPCLDFQLGICSAPAVGKISKVDYGELISGAILFLQGKNESLKKDLERIMKEAAENEDFEKAAKLRDKIFAIVETLEKQQVVDHNLIDRDVFVAASDDKTLLILIMIIRDGRLVDLKNFLYKDNGLPMGEVFSSFMTQYYRGNKFVPSEIYVETEPYDGDTISEWLNEKSSTKTIIKVPQRGDGKRLVELAKKNAEEILINKVFEKAQSKSPLKELSLKLKLRNEPKLIEAYDISNIGTEHRVGAMVCFKDGVPFKKNYRKFKIRDENALDDYSMLKEVLTRRFKRDEWAFPDLVIIDGGKGQLNIAREVLKELKLNIPVIAVAKYKEETDGGGKRTVRGRATLKGEQIFLPNVKDAKILKEGTKADRLVKLIRDEVHRFAIGYHRDVRSKAIIKSVLEDIKGIGPQTRKELFKIFIDLEGIKNASPEDLANVKGVCMDKARLIKDVLNSDK